MVQMRSNPLFMVIFPTIISKRLMIWPYLNHRWTMEQSSSRSTTHIVNEALCAKKVCTARVLCISYWDLKGLVHLLLGPLGFGATTKVWCNGFWDLQGLVHRLLGSPGFGASPTRNSLVWCTGYWYLQNWLHRLLGPLGFGATAKVWSTGCWDLQGLVYQLTVPPGFGALPTGNFIV